MGGGGRRIRNSRLASATYSFDSSSLDYISDPYSYNKKNLGQVCRSVFPESGRQRQKDLKAIFGYVESLGIDYVIPYFKTTEMKTET